MLSSAFVITVTLIYIGALFALAEFAERRGTRFSDQVRAILYCLSFSIFNTAWAVFGAVGEVFNGGAYSYLSYNFSISVSAFLWWIVLRKMVRLKDRYRITNVADFLSTRYGKSLAVGVVATLACLLTVVPYISLQLRSVSTSFNLLTGVSEELLIRPGVSQDPHGAGIISAVAMGLFTFLFGLRKNDPTERHTGMIAAVSAEGVIKLAAFVAIGIFATWSLHDGIADLFAKAGAQESLQSILSPPNSIRSYTSWFTNFLMAVFASLLLPRMFHVAVVENSNEDHIRAATWFVPIYTLAFAVFVVPIALAGALIGLNPQAAEYFALKLPLASGHPGLALLIFIGGYSAASAMMITSLTAVSLMLSNYLILPLADYLPFAASLRRSPRQIRWLSTAIVLLLAYLFMISAGTQLTLIGVGTRAFAAIMQLAPATFGGMLWKRANRNGAICGISGGLLVWVYTILLPSLERIGIPIGVLKEGPFGIRFLHPEGLFGSATLDPVSHAVFWSMVANIGLWIFGSIVSNQRELERATAADFHLFTRIQRESPTPEERQAKRTLAPPKLIRIREVLGRYMAATDAERVLNESLHATALAERRNLSLEESAALLTEVEKRLSGTIGSAWSHRAIESAEIFSRDEIESLSRSYGRVLASLQISPTELQRRVDYYRERESLLISHAAELQRRIDERDHEFQLREEAEAAQARLTSILETTSDYVAILDPNAKVLYINKALSDHLPSSPKDLSGLCSPEFERLIRETAMPVAAHEGLWRGEAKLKGEPAQSEIDISLVIIAHKAPDGSLNFFSMIARDISEQKRVEANLLRAKETAEAADRMKSEFVATVSHELRTPLNAIIGGADLLAGERDGIHFDEALALIRRNAQSLSSLIDDILTYSQVAAGKISLRTAPVPVTELTQEMLSLFQAQAVAKGVAFRCEISPKLPHEIQANRSRLRQVLVNLIGNAVKFTSTGEIILRIFPLDDREIRFEVQDTGLGVPPGALERLFRPFSQVDSSLTRRFSGTGMGLVISKKLVEAMGGQIGVTSKQAQGSLFWFTLPIVSASSETRLPASQTPAALSAAATTPAAAPTPATPFAPARILVADDSPDNQFVIQRLLKKLGQACDLVDDGEQAVEAARDKSYDLIFMDIMMPKLNGLEALREIRAFKGQNGKVPIVAMTARVMKEDCDSYIAAGANAVLPKPVDLESLRQVLARNLKTRAHSTEERH